jgi:exopolyphosphatase/guanosine-5'-triphosphate,3'-diphosphate pyrophosphatase
MRISGRKVRIVRVAAIDCGTNSIRLLVAQLEGGGLSDLHREMRIVRLGQDVDATGRLAPEAVERTRVALADYAAVARRAGAQRVRMVATSATRDAANREDFFAMVRETLGTDAEVITGDEEAQLSFTGAVGGLDPADGPFLVVDVGGGSTEVVLGDFVRGDLDGTRADVAAARSVNVGCVRITERHLRSDPPTPEEVNAAEQFATQTLQQAFAEVPVDKARTWVGVAGTVTTLSAIAQQLPAYDPARTHLSRLSLEQVRHTAEHLLASTHQQRASNPVIHSGRVDVIAGGALIVRVLAEELHTRAGISELVVSEHDILDGIALGLA